MATKKSQRIGIWIIAFVLFVGTIGSFAVIILANENTAKDSKRAEEMQAEYSRKYQEYTEAVQKQADELSSKHYDSFGQYASRVAAFDLDSVKELTKIDLVVGSGAEITESSSYAAYYVGWNPKGKVFDQSISEGKLKAPLAVTASSGLIAGWKDGVKGMKIGGVREITIPSDQAYGEKGQGDDIPPNTPLKFVIMAIDPPATITQPEMPQELIKLLYGGL